MRQDPRSRRWQARYRDRSGRQRTKTFPTKADARAYLSSVEVDLARGTWSDPALARLHFSSYAARWRATVAHLGPGTLANLDSILHRHLLPAFGTWEIGRIEPTDVRAFVANLSAGGLSSTTIPKIYRILARIMDTAETDGLIPRTPCRGIRLPRQTSTLEPCFLSPEQVHQLAEAIDTRFSTLITTAAYTGMRWGELAGLRVHRIHFLRGTLEVAEAMTEVGGVLHLGPTKTGRTRTISLPRFLCDLLAEQIRRYPNDEGFVFTGHHGGPLRRKFYLRDYKPAVERAGLPSGLRFHDLRHTCASLLIAQGAHPKEIQERLGHSTIQLTFDRYGHLLPTLDDRLREGLEAAWAVAEGR